MKDKGDMLDMIGCGFLILMIALAYLVFRAAKYYF